MLAPPVPCAYSEKIVRGEVNLELGTEQNWEIRWINQKFEDLLHRGAKHVKPKIQKPKNQPPNQTRKQESMDYNSRCQQI